jgi:hypothetical protein
VTNGRASGPDPATASAGGPDDVLSGLVR